jgi:hypothetical protein
MHSLMNHDPPVPYPHTSSHSFHLNSSYTSFPAYLVRCIPTSPFQTPPFPIQLLTPLQILHPFLRIRILVLPTHQHHLRDSQAQQQRTDTRQGNQHCPRTMQIHTVLHERNASTVTITHVPQDTTHAELTRAREVCVGRVPLWPVARMLGHVSVARRCCDEGDEREDECECWEYIDEVVLSSSGFGALFYKSVSANLAAGVVYYLPW